MADYHVVRAVDYGTGNLNEKEVRTGVQQIAGI
jgi:hypothetical protein